MTARIALPVTLAALLLPAAAAHAAPKIKPCPKAGKTLAVDKDKSGEVGGRVFKRKGVVYGCSTYYPSYGRVTRLGRFTPRLVAIDGTEAIWTVRKAGTDRVSQAELYSGRRKVRSRVAVPKTAADASRAAAKVDAVRVDPNGVFAWIAGTGQLVVGGQELSSDLAVTGTDGAASTAFADGNLGVVATLPDLSAAQRRAVVSGMTIEVASGEGDECGGSNPVTWSWTSPLGDASARTDVSSTNPIDTCS